MTQKSNSITPQIAELFAETFCSTPASIVTLPGGGGDRKYFRLTFDSDAASSDMEGPAGGSCIAAYSPNSRENNLFYTLAKGFRKRGVMVPEVFAISSDSHIILQEDLGDTQLLSLLQTDNAKEPVEATMRNLAKMQTVRRGVWDSKNLPIPFCKRLIMWDLNYFKYEYLKPGGYTFDENLLEDDFEKFARDLKGAMDVQCGFMMRDCQSRNVMVKDGTPYLIDFQDGRKGPGIYDAVSFLWQAKAGFSDDFRQEMLNVYAEALMEFGKNQPGFKAHNPSEIKALAPKMALFRTLQVLGAYGFRGLVQKKSHFIESIPAALKNLEDLINKGVSADYPELTSVAMQMIADERFIAHENDGRLHVKVFSFSYKQGYPEDLSGNGGGFMFDCRAMHNPGRYAEYKPLTGLDKPVRDFLEERGEIQKFLAAAEILTFPAVERYLQRGFTSLQIGFGCTGGRHRSVYSADTLGHKLAETFPDAVVEIIHREQGIIEILNK